MRRAALPLLLAPALVAQGLTSGGLQGVVRAADGSSLAGARLELEEVCTGRRHATISGPEGAFRFLGLEPGPCRLTVTAEGYGGQRLSGLRIRAGANLDLPVELVPMESGMVMDTEVPEGLPAGSRASLLRLPARLLRALPLRTGRLAGLADLGPWPLATPALRVDGLDFGASGAAPSPLGPESLAEAGIRTGGGEADTPGAEALTATTRAGGNAFEGEAQALWGPSTDSASDRRSGTLALAGPLRRDRLFAAFEAAREAPGDGSAATRGALRLDWLPTDTQQATLRALDALASGIDAGRDRSLALAHRWTPVPGIVQEARLQAREAEAPGLAPARAWEASEALGLALGAHAFQSGADLQQLNSGPLPGAAWHRTGLFLEDAWQVAPPFALRLGLRRDREDLAGGTLQEGTSPRLAFAWQLSARLTLTGGTGRFIDPTPLIPFLPRPAPAAWPDRREHRLGLAFQPLPDLLVTLEGREASGRLAPGGGDRDRLQGGSLGGRWRVGETLDLAASWTVGRVRTERPVGLPDGAFRRLRLWAVWDTRDVASPWARDWTLALVGRLQSGGPWSIPGLPQAPGAPVLDLRLARAFGGRGLRLSAILEAFDLLDRTRPSGAPGTPEAGRRLQMGVRAAF